MALSFMRSRTPSEAAEVPEIDVTPVMNMFVILIPFLVSMAVFTHLSIVEFSVPPAASSAVAGAGEKPRQKLTVVLQPHYLAITAGEKLLDSLPLVDGEYDFARLRTLLPARRAAAEVSDEAVVASSDAVAFRHVVAAMDECRAAGIAKVGLAAAPSAEGAAP